MSAKILTFSSTEIEKKKKFYRHKTPIFIFNRYISISI